MALAEPPLKLFTIRWGWFSEYGNWLGFAAEIVVLLLIAWIVRRVILGYLGAWAKKTGRVLDEQLFALIRSALGPLLLLAAIAITVNSLPIQAHILFLSNRLFKLVMVGIGLYYSYQAVMAALTTWLRRDRERESLIDPSSFFVRVLFAGLGTILVLENLGVSLKAVWTTVGVGSVAVALALQDTLTNFFAGVYLRIDQPVRTGDYIKLEGNEEGFVNHLGWRSTRIKTLSNNLVVVPNSKLSSAILTNYSMPETKISVGMPISVSYDADLDRVITVLVEEAKAAAATVEGLLADPAPAVSLIPGFGEYALNLTLGYTVATYVDQYRAQDALRKRILERFRTEGITIPVPQRDVHLHRYSDAKEPPREPASGSPDSKAA